MNVYSFHSSLHGLRGLSALLIFSVHVLNGFSIHLNPDFGVNWIHVFSNIGAFGVEIFFVLSGFVIIKTSQKSNASNFFFHRFWRLYPLFFTLSVIYFIGNTFTHYDPEKLGVLNLISNLFFLNLFLDTPALTPNSWSLTYEIWYYILTFYIFSFLKKKENICLGVLSLLILPYFLINHPVTIYFLIGVLLFLFTSNFNISSQNINFINAVQLTTFAFLLVLLSRGEDFHWGVSLSLFIPPLLFLHFLTLLRYDSIFSRFLSNRFFIFLGNISFSLYLCHPYSYLFTRELTSHLSGYIGENNLFLFFIITTSIITFLLSCLVSVFFENFIYRKATGKSIYVNY